MSYREDLLAASRFLQENDHFLIVNHVSPDGDATGSLLAMGHILQALGKNFILANEGKTPEKFLFIPLSEKVMDLSEQTLSKKYQHVIAVDCGDFPRVGDACRFFADDVQLLNIDHHPTNDQFGTVNLVRVDACATAEILFDLALEMNITFTNELATALYMGILTDTGGFRYSNTNAEVMEKIAVLLKHGVRPADVAERCLETISQSYLRLLQLVLPSLTMYKDNQVAFLSITLEAMEQSQATSEDMEGMVNYARNIEGVEVGVLFKQMDSHTVKASLRSKKEINVSAIAKELGGGGHARAAGCTIKDGLDKAQHIILEKLNQVWG